MNRLRYRRRAEGGSGRLNTFSDSSRRDLKERTEKSRG